MLSGESPAGKLRSVCRQVGDSPFWWHLLALPVIQVASADQGNERLAPCPHLWSFQASTRIFSRMRRTSKLVELVLCCRPSHLVSRARQFRRCWSGSAGVVLRPRVQLLPVSSLQIGYISMLVMRMGQISTKMIDFRRRMPYSRFRLSVL